MSATVSRQAYVGLGSNLADPRQQVLDAIEALRRVPALSDVRASSLYRTPPWGVLDQPDFVNAVVSLHTTLAPGELLALLQALEARAGRVRDGTRWGPRILDLDLLHMQGVTSSAAPLLLPHPRIAQRAFVLLPLAELAPGLQLPGQGRVLDLLAGVDPAGCVRVT